MTGTAVKLTNDRTLKWTLYDFAVGFYLFTIILADGTILFDLSVVLLVGLGVLRLLSTRRFSLNLFMGMMALFIVYNAIIIFAGVVEFPEVSTKRLITVGFNFVVNILLAQYLIEESNRKKCMRCFIALAMICIVYILAFSWRSLFQGRFGVGTPYLFGLRGANGDFFLSNYVCRILYTAFVFCIYLRWNVSENNKSVKQARKYLFLALIFAFFSAMTGSRAGIIFIAMFLVLSYVMKSRSFESKLKYLVITVMVLGIVYLAIMYIPALYNVVGRRLEILLNGVLSDDGYAYRSTAYFRDNMRNLGRKWFLERPIFGWGLDAFTQLSPYETYSHNNFIEILVSSGIVGFLFYYGGIAFLFMKCSAARKNERSRTEAIVFFSFLAAAVFMNVAHVDYVSRDSLFLFYMTAAAVADWGKGGVILKY